MFEPPLSLKKKTIVFCAIPRSSIASRMRPIARSISSTMAA
jgi:hypothetical protein